MELGNLDFLVQLASLGTSGVCIFTIFWVGTLLRNSSANAEQHKTIRHFITASVVIACISAASGVANAAIKQSRINQLQEDNSTLSVRNETISQRNEALSTQLTQATVQFQEYKSVAEATLSDLTAQLQVPNDPQIRNRIETLRNYSLLPGLAPE